jgi:hypothetical protein
MLCEAAGMQAKWTQGIFQRVRNPLQATKQAAKFVI